MRVGLRACVPFFAVATRFRRCNVEAMAGSPGRVSRVLLRPKRVVGGSIRWRSTEACPLNAQSGILR